MALTRAQVAALYSPIYDEFMLATFKEETQKQQVLFQQINDSTREYRVDDISGLGEWVDATEAEGGGYETPVLGYPKTFTPVKKWKKFQVSFEAVDQDEYALLKKEDDAKQMGRGARARVERGAAAVLYDGFTTACPDAANLWSIAHPKSREAPGVLYDNLLTGPFSHDNLELAEAQIADNFFDMKGIPIETIDDPYLIYPPGLRGIVTRTMDERALERPGTVNRDINRFAGRYKMLEWRWLANALGGSDTAWFIIFPELGFLKFIWQARPHFASWINEDLELYCFKGRMIGDVGVSNWRAGFASTGL